MRAADAEPRPALRLDRAVARRSRPSGERAVPSLQLAGPRRDARLEGPEPARRSGLRPVRQWHDRDQGRHQPLRSGGVDRRRVAVWPDGQLQHDAQLDRPNGNFFPDCDLKNPAAQDLRRVAATSAAPTTRRASAPSCRAPA